MAFTAPVTRATDFLVTAAVWNAEHVDNMNSAWPHLIVRKTADESVTSSTTFQNDDHISMSLAANEIWQTELWLYITGGVGDFKMTYTFPAGATVPFFGGVVNSADAIQGFFGTATSGTEMVNASSNTSNLALVHALVINGGTAGTLQLQWAQAASSATPTVLKANSTLWGVKLA